MKKFLFIIFVALFFAFAPFWVRAAVLSFSSSAANYNVGDVFKVDVNLDTQGQSINAADAVINFDKNVLEAESVSQGGSIFSLWAQMPSYSNENGEVSFVGGIPGGFTGSGKIISVFFKVKQTGNTGISFQNGADVMLNDGKGTKAGLSYQNAEFSLGAASGTPKNEMQAALISDTTPPEPFSIQLSNDPAIFDGKYFIVFSTQDLQSGIDHYEVKEGNSPWQVGTSPYLLNDQTLSGKILVKAVDKAGNIRIASYNPNGSFPYWIIALIVVIFGIILIFLKFRKKGSREK